MINVQYGSWVPQQLRYTEGCTAEASSLDSPVLICFQIYPGARNNCRESLHGDIFQGCISLAKSWNKPGQAFKSMDIAQLWR